MKATIYIIIGIILLLRANVSFAQETIIINAKDSNKVIERDTLLEVTVSSAAARQRLNANVVGAEKIEMKLVAKTPVLFGERDIMKAIQLLPGVKSEGEGTSGYQVRGGTASQNLVLLDNAIVYNSGHLMGLFSAFNDEVLTNATLYKGSVPAQFGGGVSSVFDISTKQGDMQSFHGSAGIGLLSAKAAVEGPLIGDRSSFLVAARRSYLDIFLKATDDYSDTKLNFYDINAKISLRANAKNDLSISAFHSRDNIGLNDLVDMKWGNTAFGLRWFHTNNRRFFSLFNLSHSRYNSDIMMEILSTNFVFGSFIHHTTATESITLQLSDEHRLRLGAQAMYISLQTADWKMNATHFRELRHAWQSDAWFSWEANFSERLSAVVGLRVNHFAALGGEPYYNLDEKGNIVDTLRYASTELVEQYFTPEPRINLKYALSATQSLKFGYAHTVQNIHAIRNTTTSSMPFDRYVMNSNIVEPMKAQQASIAYVGATNNGVYDLTIEAYYKQLSNVYDYRDGKTFNSEVEMERLIRGGKGRAYGLEICARKNVGRLSGWASYTLSWSENKIDGINNGNWYDAANDRRHDLSLVGMFDLNDRWQLSASWIFTSGQALTAPSAKYTVLYETQYYFAERSGYRGPAVHHLDLSATRRVHHRRFDSIWNFSIYNLYNRYNPYMITFSNDKDEPTGTSAQITALFGIVPSVSYTIEF